LNFAKKYFKKVVPETQQDFVGYERERERESEAFSLNTMSVLKVT